jgi:hypothetical protein
VPEDPELHLFAGIKEADLLANQVVETLASAGFCTAT